LTKKNGKSGKPRAASKKLTPEMMEVISTTLGELLNEVKEEAALYTAGNVVVALALGYEINRADIKLEIGKPRGMSISARLGVVQVDACITAEDLELAGNGDSAMLQRCEEGCIIFLTGAVAADTDLFNADTESLRAFFQPCFKARYGRKMEDNEADRKDAKDLVDVYVGRTCQLLAENWEAVELATTMLLEKETLSPEDIEDVRKAITWRTPIERAEKAIA
jgi:hypothetical protein